MTGKSWRGRLFELAQLAAGRLRPVSDREPGKLETLSPDEVGRLADDVFVHWAYEIILNRAPDDEGRLQYAAALRSGRLSRERFLLILLNSAEYRENLVNREFVTPGHFFSAVPSWADRQRFLQNGAQEKPVMGIDLRHAEQMALLEKLRPFVLEAPFPEQPDPAFRYYFDNPAYAYGDGLMLHSMLRHFKPRRIIEIGCGFSSTVIMDTNDLFFDGQIDVRFIDPYPQLVHKLMRPADRERYPVIAEPIQTVDLTVFDDLEENDVLFIDSTHVSKLGSDVNREFFDILPRLKPGVLVHIHDIAWPFEYPAEWIEEGRAWNENYLVRAFLAYNSAFEIVLFTAYLHTHPEAAVWLEREMPLTRNNPGGQLWIRRISN